MLVLRRASAATATATVVVVIVVSFGINVHVRGPQEKAAVARDYSLWWNHALRSVDWRRRRGGEQSCFAAPAAGGG